MALDYSPRRVVCLQPSATVTLARLGVLDRVVACTRYCADVCPEVRAAGCAIVADSWTAQAVEIATAKPDLVIASVPYQPEAVVEILKSGARFLGLAPRTLADVYGDIAAIAGVMHCPAAGDEIIHAMQQVIREFCERCSPLPRKRVFCEEWGKPLIHSQPWVAELVTAAGGEFIGVPGTHTDATAVAQLAPDVLLFAWCGAGDRVPLEKIVSERGWEQLPAARSGQVYCIADELLNTPAPTLVSGLRALAAAIHPQEFPTPVRGLRRIASAGQQRL